MRRRLKELSEKHSFPVVMTTTWKTPPVVEKTCEELGFLFIPGLGVGEKYLREHGGAEYRGSALTRSKTDLHPSPLFHRLLGEHYYKELARRKLLD